MGPPHPRDAARTAARGRRGSVLTPVPCCREQETSEPHPAPLHTEVRTAGLPLGSLAMSEVDPGACAALVTHLRGRCAADVTAMPPGPFRRSPSGLSLGSLLCATPGPDHATWDVVLATVLPRHRHGPGRALPAQHLTLIPAPSPSLAQSTPHGTRGHKSEHVTRQLGGLPYSPIAPSIKMQLPQASRANQAPSKPRRTQQQQTNDSIQK